MSYTAYMSFFVSILLFQYPFCSRSSEGHCSDFFLCCLFLQMLNTSLYDTLSAACCHLALVCDALLLCRPPFFLRFVTALLNAEYFSVPLSLFKLSHGHPALRCLLRHYVSTITGNCRSQNALSSPRVYVCILNTVKRRDSHAHTRDSAFRIGFLLSGPY